MTDIENQTNLIQIPQYNLKTELQNEKLTVHLTDLVDGYLYRKQYIRVNNNENYLNFLDIFTTLNAGKIQNKNTTEQKVCIKQAKKYTYGNIIQYNHIPCFKVQRSGIITVFECFVNQLTKNKIIKQNILVLDQIQNNLQYCQLINALNQHQQRRCTQQAIIESSQNQNQLLGQSEFNAELWPKRKRKNKKKIDNQKQKLKKNYNRQICDKIIKWVKKQNINESYYRELHQKDKYGLSTVLLRQELKEVFIELFLSNYLHREVLLSKTKNKQKIYNLSQVRRIKIQFINNYLEQPQMVNSIIQ